MEKSIWKVNGVKIECIRGDISNQPGIDAVVNAANAQLRTGGGVAGAIHKKAGPGLQNEGRKYAPISPGEAVITGAYGLPNRHVIHCLGPVYGVDTPSEKLLSSCYKNALKTAQEKGVGSIAFPAISTGAFGYPSEQAAKIAIKTVYDMLKEPGGIKKIRFVLFSKKDYFIYKDIIDNMTV